jgi:hypothetical protein
MVQSLEWSPYGVTGFSPADDEEAADITSAPTRIDRLNEDRISALICVIYNMPES